MIPVKNAQVWQEIRVLFLAAALLYLATIAFGFDNALTADTIARWQILVHAHTGTLGWVTLSAMGFMFWLLTSKREVTAPFVRRVRLISWSAIVLFAGFVVSLGLAFSRGQPFFMLLPIFGLAAALLIWTAALFCLTQLRRQPVVTTSQILLTAGFAVAAAGSTMGVLLGSEYVVGFFIPGTDRIGSHAAVMDAYVLLFAAAIVEEFLGREQRWTWAGLALALAWTVSGLLVIPGLLFMPSLATIFGPLLLIGLVLFVARSGWRALRSNPLGEGPERWLFFGTLWAILWAILFMYLGVAYAGNTLAIPHWVGVIFQHASFVGVMTNLLLGVYSVHTRDSAHLFPRAETAAMWLINLGLVAFFALELAADSRLGALVMGAGVLLGVVTMIARLVLADPSWAYDLLYSGRAPWEMDKPREELVAMVESGEIQPCRAIDLGCGTGDNVIFLAQHGFDAVGVDLSARAIAQAQERAAAAGVSPSFVTGDVTDLNGVAGSFDLVIDYGCLGCVLSAPAREQYVETLLRLARPGSDYLLLNFAHKADNRFNLIPVALRPGEVDRLLGDAFAVEAYESAADSGPFGLSVEFRHMRRRLPGK
ncbi:MAG: methyltransferase domain-containing protein [Anaerolineae bacterium]|nr:methyltransferase domain-containing protein [Anaerolineae bacterium]